ncbi:tyrosine-type recombinase/integrase [Streptomyces sp. NPDC058734]|uniref:tyrosine-type recombinase/integrase n=1 Tax=Streptomyces sp. NPDC058734 TaxID=3346615 RepID=UPI0036BDF7E2
MFLCSTSRTSLLHAAHPEAAVEALDRAGVCDGIPFVLGADGRYDVELNRFIRELPSWGVRSPHSVEAYARDLMVFGRFLHLCRGGRSVWEAGPEDLRAFKRARRPGPAGEGVAASTWNRFIAALDKFVEWALAEALLAADPFRRVERTVWTPQGVQVVRVNAEREVDEESGPIRFLPYEDYLLWRDVGLRGMTPDGRVDSQWRGRHGERNSAFADKVVGTGMRLTEASSVLLPEVPPAGRDRAGAMTVAGSTAKRRRSRTVFWSRRLVRSVHAYIDVERDALVARWSARDAYADEADALVVREARASRMVLIEGEPRARLLARLEPADRRRLRWGSGGGPVWLWLGDGGRPMEPSAWQAVFRRANERCRGFGLDFDVHPHTLRHTFAVHMLGLLLRETVRALRMDDRVLVTSAQMKRLLIGDPLRRLQLLLGHRRLESVFQYLDVLDEAQEIVLSALDRWDEQAQVADGLQAAGAGTVAG